MVALDGHTYERESIEAYWEKPSEAYKSPMTTAKLDSQQLFPNVNLRSLAQVSNAQ